MTTARITAVMLDGTKHEATGVFMALSDRVAFERLYNVSALEMARQTDLLAPDGTPTAAVSDLREERHAFFCWRLLRRAELPVGEFDEFIENTEECHIETLKGPVDPTDPDQPPGT
jgi:hypothetical protein